MLVHAKKVAALIVMALVTAVISLPGVSLAAVTSPTVVALSPLVSGLSNPVRMALDADSNIYVTYQRNRAYGVVKYDCYGAYQGKFVTAAAPAGLAFAKDGALLVSQANFVARYNVTTGEEIGRMEDGKLVKPVGVAVDDVTGFVYVADAAANQVVMFNEVGGYAGAFGKGVSVTAAGATVFNPVGKLSAPTGITFEKSKRNLVVADSASNRVQFFDVNGNFVKSIGDSLGVGDPLTTMVGGTAIVPMQFMVPNAIAFEYSKDIVPVINRMYVVDSLTHVVQVVNPETDRFLPVPSGSATNIIGGAVGIAASGSLMGPSDVAYDMKSNRLFVVSSGSGKVVIYGIDGGKTPIYVDVTPPAFAVNPVPAEVMVDSVTISGTVEVGASVQVASNGAAQLGAVVYSGASWSVQVSGLEAGKNAFTITAKDVVGNVALPQSVSLTYLLPAPSLTVSSVVPVLTNVATMDLVGTVEAGTSVTVINDITKVSGDAVVVGTEWTYKVALGESVNNITVTAQKPLSAKNVKFLVTTLDTVSPVLTVSALADGSYTTNQNQNITGNVKDASVATVLINNVPAAIDGSGTFSVLLPLEIGANEVNVVAIDLAGNASPANIRTINYDSRVPQLAVTTPVDNSYTNIASVQLTGSVDKVASVVVSGVPAIVENNNWTANIELVAGLNTIEVVATDLYGLTSTLKRSITLDSVKPVLSILVPPQDVAVTEASVMVSGVVSDNNTTLLTYSLNGGAPLASPVVDGNYSFNVDLANGEGIYTLMVTAIDTAGNATTATRNISYAQLTIDPVPSQIQAKISGTAKRGSVIVVKEGNVALDKVKVKYDGDKWAADLGGINYNPTKLSFEAKDATGNILKKLILNKKDEKDRKNKK